MVSICEMKNIYKILVRKPEWKRPLRRPKHRLEDNIRMALKGTGSGVDWMHLAQDRDQGWGTGNMIINL
jgi:hypothetical protein